MTDADAQSLPTLEEMQTALASLDPKLARIFRARLGLAPAEPEPSALTCEPEPPKAEPTAALPLDLDPAARAIDPDALQRLNAEIEEKAKAEQEAAAAKRVEQEAARHAAEKDPAIVAVMEPIEARARKVSPVKRRLEEGAVRIRMEPVDKVLYQHSVFCQTVLPYRDPGPDVRKWEREQGKARLLLEAGHIKGPAGGFIPVGLPYGPAARLLIAYLNTTALQTHNRVIETGCSMTAYFRRLSGRQAGGRDIHRFKEQFMRVSGCVIRVIYDLGECSIQVNSQIVSAFDLLEERFEGERFLFPQTIALSVDYFENLMTHAVPLDERAIAALAYSAMALDVYMWLAQRLHRIDPDRPQFIPWTALYDQFGQGYNRIRDFRRDLVATLKRVLTQYPAARVKLNKGGILLAYSPPPVPSRHVILLPPTKTAKE